MTGHSILMIEDEPGLALTVGDLLRGEDHRVEVESDGRRGLERAAEGDGFDLILLDVMLPGLSGFEVCRGLRRRGVETPILMLTARGEVRDRVQGLRLGADDYLVKPFDPLELVARVDALLRRTRERQAPAVVRFGDVEVDLRAMTVRRGGSEVELAAMEYQLLAHLVRHEGQALAREAILRDVWGFHEAPRTRTVDVHVTWLRGKLEPDRSSPRYIRTVRGVGYRFTGDDDQPGS